MVRQFGAGFGTSEEPYKYREVVNATSYPKVEVTNFEEVSGYENLLTLSNITTSGTFVSSGYFNNMFDGDTSTYYSLDYNFGSTGIIIQFDLTTRKLIEVMTLQYDVYSPSNLTTIDVYWEISDDGTNWTSIKETLGVNNQTIVVNEQIANKELRYIRMRMNITASGSTGGIQMKSIQVLNKVSS